MVSVRSADERRVRYLWDRRKEGRGWAFRRKLKTHDGGRRVLAFKIGDNDMTKGQAEAVRDAIVTDLGIMSPEDVIRKHQARPRFDVRQGAGAPGAPGAPEPAGVKVHTLRQAADAWIAECEFQGTGPKQLHDIRAKLGVICAFFGPAFPVADVTPDRVTALRQALLNGYQARKATRSARTVSIFLGVLKSAFSLALDHGHEVGTNPTSRVLKTVQAQRRNVTVHWGFVAAVIKRAALESPELALWCLILRDSGARPREVHALTWEHARRRRRGATAGLVIDFRALAKSNKIKHRTIRLTSPEVLDAFERLRAERQAEGTAGPEDLVFTGRLDAKTKQIAALITAERQARKWSKDRAAAAFRGVSDFRHEAVMTLGISGCPTREAMAITGHSNAHIHFGYGGKDFSKGKRPPRAVYLEHVY